MYQPYIFLAYFGPETTLPMTSILATIAALIALFGKAMFRSVAGWIGRRTFSPRRHGAAVGPHRAVRRRTRQTTRQT